MDIRLLGPLTVTDSEGEEIPVPGERQRVLLALLALERPRAVSSDEIVEAVWSRKLPTKPEAALHIAVSRLRGVLGRDAVETVKGGYRLSPKAARLDLDRFQEYASWGRQLTIMGDHPGAAEAFRQALGQWRGAPFSGLRAFEFAEAAARRLEEERLVLVEEMLEAELAADHHAQVLSDLTGLVEAFPLRERLWGLLMVALYRSGRQAEALRAFARAREILATELGVDPSPELVELEEQILRHDLRPPDESPGRPRDTQGAGHVETLHFEPGDVIVEQGSSADEIYWIEEGRVEAYRTGVSTGSVIGELSAGQYFGELSSLLGIGRTASIRAVTTVVVSVHSPEGFRARLASRWDAGEIGDGITTASVRELIRRGDYLRAFDRASRGVQQQPGDPLMRYLAVLSLARAGATSRAMQAFESYDLGRTDLETLSPSLAIDIAALPARLEKDRALRASGDERRHWARRSSDGYRRAFERFDSPYLLVNAATMALVAGDPAAARRDAAAVAERTDGEPDGYWELATRAEALLLLGDPAGAAEQLSQSARSEGANAASKATTLRQLRLVCDILDVDSSILEPIENPAVVHFGGHMVDGPGRPGRLREEDLPRVADAFSQIFDRLNAGIGYGSLAAGSDIVAAEALLERGGDLHVVLPFARDEFVERSVRPAGEAWVKRFDACLERARSVDYATVSEYLGDDILFDFCAGIAMGGAVIHADFLQTEVHQVAVWDGQGPAGVGGTAGDVSRWREAGLDATIIPVEPLEPVRRTGSPSKPGRSVRFLLYADFAGFSTLSDRRIVRFQTEVMEELARTISGYQEGLLSGRTWGDGLYLVFDSVDVAADCALALQTTVTEMDLLGLDLGGLRGLRVAGHATPVFDGWDPISDTRLFYGLGVTQVARIEPRTPEGEVYVTKEFASLAMLSGRRTFECQYVGTVPTAKGYGPLPLFSLSRSHPRS